ncbi:MAG: replicative DNA helicase [Actinobacteria bacterium]|nr:replicative DNA helicase [Actinomycetota bacterium]
MAERDHIVNLTPTQKERAMPQNLDAERAVLAAMILSPAIVEELLSKIKNSSVFYRPAHQKIYESILDLYEKSVPIDQLSLADRLAARGELEVVGGKPYIIELANNSFALANWATHAEIVNRTALLRDLIAASTQITAMSYDAPDDIDEVVEEAEKLIFKVTEKRVSQGFVKIDQLMMNSFKTLRELAEQKTHIVGIPTGFTELDKLLAGLRGGSLTVLAARPGVGKTAFILNLAVNAAKQGVSVAVFSLEMSAAEIMPRILASEARVSLSSMRSGHLESNDWLPITAAGDVFSRLNMWIDDSPSLSILEMRAKSRRLLRDCNGNGLIIVDYLQLMQPQGKKSESRQVEIAEISRGLKILAKDLNVPVIALSQLNRAAESRPNRRPQLSDLRESGAIEQDADIVMFIDRSKSEEEAMMADRPELGTAFLIVEKNRNGPTKTIQLAFLDSCTRFSDLARLD